MHGLTFFKRVSRAVSLLQIQSSSRRACVSRSKSKGPSEPKGLWVDS